MIGNSPGYHVPMFRPDSLSQIERGGSIARWMSDEPATDRNLENDSLCSFNYTKNALQNSRKLMLQLLMHAKFKACKPGR
jgi:hypothetical protein